MKNTAQVLYHEARQFRDTGNFEAARIVAQEAAARGSLAANELAAQMAACVRAIYGPTAAAAAEAFEQELAAENGSFITRNTELNLERDLRYACPKLNKHLYLTAEGVSFCRLAPVLPCAVDNLPQQLAALRLCAEQNQAGLLFNQGRLCGNCQHLAQTTGEPDRAYGPLELHISEVKPKAYDLPALLNRLGDAGLLGPGGRYEVSEPVSGPEAMAQLKEIMAILRRHGLRGFLCIAPEEFSLEISEALAEKRVEIVCAMHERSPKQAWANLQRYCAVGGAEAVTVSLAFQSGGIPAQILQNFLECCLEAGCRRLEAVFNEQLAADDLLLDNKDFLEKSAFLLDLDLRVDQESLDATVFNRKVALQRAQADWLQGKVPLTITGHRERKTISSDTLLGFSSPEAVLFSARIGNVS